MKGKVVALGLVCMLAAAVGLAMAQETTVEVKHGQVLAIHGNDLVYRGSEGVKTVTVPEDFRFNVEGRELSVHELKPGMKLTAQITTTTRVIPMTVTEVRSGEIVHTQGGAVVVRKDDGKLVKFTQKTIKESGAAVTKDGKRIDLTTLREGDRISATVVTKLPPEIITEQDLKVYASSPPPKPAPKPVVVAKKQPKPAPSTLPKTAGPLPLIGLAGIAMFGAGLGLTITRRLRNR